MSRTSITAYPWTDAEREQLRRMRVDERQGYGAIADAMGISEESLRWQADKMGLPKVKVARTYSPGRIIVTGSHRQPQAADDGPAEEEGAQAKRPPLPPGAGWKALVSGTVLEDVAYPRWGV